MNAANIKFDVAFRHREAGRPWREHLETIVELLLAKRPTVRHLIESRADPSHRYPAIVLAAHGKGKRPWRYWRRGVPAEVQEWVDRHDGLAPVLIIAACNHSDAKITAEKSVVVHASTKWSIFDLLLRRGGPVRVFCPGHGYLADARAVRRAVAAIKKMPRAAR